MANTKTNSLNKADLSKISRRWILSSQLSWNYEKMMALGYFYTVLPALRKLYPNATELQDYAKLHTQFFNTTPHMGGIVLGIDLATEDSQGYQGKEAVVGIKTGLMGPLAGIGDTLFGVLIPTIFGSIAAYLALQGNSSGVFLWLLINALIVFVRYQSVFFAYKKGVQLITTMQTKLNALTDAATLLGITVIGALIPTVVRGNLIAEFQSGDVTIKIQDILNQIMPSMLPVIFVGLVYAALGMKKMSSGKMVVIIMAASILLHFFKIL